LLWGVNRHFQAKRGKYLNVHITETIAGFQPNFTWQKRPPNTRRWWSSNVENKSKISLNCVFVYARYKF